MLQRSVHQGHERPKQLRHVRHDLPDEVSDVHQWRVLRRTHAGSSKRMHSSADAQCRRALKVVAVTLAEWVVEPVAGSG